ncbi:putative Prion-inhibition and propagation HeLo domain-containing protein [Seiridium cardinale]
MAEVAALVLGAVGVVGIIGAFKDAVELFSLITAPRKFSRDYEITSTKLDIEKLILLKWADRVRLLSEDYDRRLDDGYWAWGLPTSSESKSLSAPISGARMERFAADFKRLKLDMDTHQEKSSMFTKIRWVIKDKESFVDLVTTLAHFMAKLDQIIPPQYPPQFRVQSSATADVVELHDQDLQPVVDLHKRVECELRRRKDASQNRILDLIWFRMIDERRDSVRGAHTKILDWALRPPDSGALWDDMSEWFLTGAGIYWICGKAGSG